MSLARALEGQRHSLFLLPKFRPMNTIISITFIITLVSISVFQLYRNRRSEGYVDPKSVIMPRILAALTVMSVLRIVSIGYDSYSLLVDSVVAVVSLYPLLVSIRPSGGLPFDVCSIPAVIPVVSLFYIVCMTLRWGPDSLVFLILAGLLSLFLPCIFVWMIWRRLRDLKSVMKSGNVWSFVTLCVDFIYILAPLVILYLLHVVRMTAPAVMDASVCVADVILLLEVVAIAVRVSYSSAFVLMHGHESIIVESMKISVTDASVSSDRRNDAQCKELYDRIVMYFETSKPFLDGNLTINDLVKTVYSNKVYISKAICRYTGRNFRQFVNYYRVMYSIGIFRENPEMKVTELSEHSGFNTVVSYTMAFRLFMNETPSEWCRKERAKILKPKK